MEHLRCVVERITYQNPENGYTVLKCAVKNYSDLVTVVGNMPDTHVGSVLSLEGFWRMAPKYGRQFSVEKIEKAKELLEVEEPELEITLDEMIRTGDVIRDQDAETINLPSYYFSESGCAKRLIRLLLCGRKMKADTEQIFQKTAAQSDITYDEIQMEAIKTALSSKVMVLTGGSGTGKTTTTMGIISAYQAAGCWIILAAPTGRTAKRMAEATGMEDKTIHCLLEYKPPEGYQKNEMYNLLKAMPEQMILILVGDIDQLPSVGAGNVLRDIIGSGRVQVVRLIRIFRQAQGSRSIMNAHMC